MIRQATQEDLPQIEEVLKASSTTTMFFRSNLHNAGLEGDDSRAMDVFMAENGPEGGLCGITRGGFLLAHGDASKPAIWSAFAQALKGRKIKGMTGAEPHVSAMLAALGIKDQAFQIDDLEPLYTHDLRNLPGFDDWSVRAPTQREIQLVNDWALRGDIETLSTPDTESARQEAAEQVARMIERDALRVLVVGGAPVAMTGFNATLPDCVQIGDVYTPSEYRNKGYARRAVALHLAEARAQGVQKAILFAANAAACRAYEAIGFRQVGTYRIALFKEPWEVPQ